MTDLRDPNFKRITTLELANEFIDDSVKQLKEKIKDDQVILALSGGVDSNVVAALLNKAIGKNLYCIHVNHGLLRKNESEEVLKIFKEKMNLNLIYLDVEDYFLDKLKGVSDPETKRKIIGNEFINCFVAEAKKLNGIKCKAYPTTRLEMMRVKMINKFSFQFLFSFKRTKRPRPAFTERPVMIEPKLSPPMM